MEPTADVDAMVTDAVRNIRDRFGPEGLRDLVHLASREIDRAERAVESLGLEAQPTGTAAEHGFRTVGDLLASSRQKAAIQEAMRIVAEANGYLSHQAPWKLRDADPDRLATILHVAAQAVSDANTLLSPFLPHSAQRVHELLGGAGRLTDTPEIRQVDDLDGGPSYPVITGSYEKANRWARTPLVPGTPISPPKPVYRKLDASVVDEELARLEAEAS